MKVNMEPQNHLFEKETSSSKASFSGSMLTFLAVYIRISLQTARLLLPFSKLPGNQLPFDSALVKIEPDEFGPLEFLNRTPNTLSELKQFM